MLFRDLGHLVSNYGPGVELDRLKLRMCVCRSVDGLGSNRWRLIPRVIGRGDGLKQVLIRPYAVKNPERRLLELFILHSPLVQRLGKRRHIVLFALSPKVHALVQLHPRDFRQNGILLISFFPISGVATLIFTLLDVFEQLFVIIREDHAVVLLVENLHVMSDLFFDRLDAIGLVFDEVGLAVGWTRLVPDLTLEILVCSKAICPVNTVHHRSASVDL